MKKLFAVSLLIFVFTVFISAKSYSQAQEPVKTEEVKKHCGGHDHDAKKVNDNTKASDAPKSGCAKVTTKCPSTCPHAKAASAKEAQPANTIEKRKPVPQE